MQIIDDSIKSYVKRCVRELMKYPYFPLCYKQSNVENSSIEAT